MRGAVTVDAGVDQFPPPPPPDLSELKISGMSVIIAYSEDKSMFSTSLIWQASDYNGTVIYNIGM